MLARAWLLALLILLVCGVLLARLFHLQIIEGERYARAVHESQLSMRYVPARRGLIRDRHGTVLADNRAVYHIAVQLSELELDRRRQRRTPFLLFDRPRFDTLIAELAPRTLRDPGELREIIKDELLRFPGVAVRRGQPSGTGQPELLALPKDAIMAGVDVSGRSDESDTPEESPEPTPELTEADERIGRLAASGLLHDDPRAAMLRELSLRRQQDWRLLDDDDLTAVTQDLAQRFDVPTDLLVPVLEPFVPLLTLQAASDDQAGIQIDEGWRLFGAEQQRHAATGLARFLGVAPSEVDAQLDAALSLIDSRVESSPWFFVPAAFEERLAGLLPEQIELARLTVAGMPAARQRIFILQGDTDGDADGLLSLLARRIAAGLTYDPEELELLLLQHGERLNSKQVLRRFRLHHIALDPELLARLLGELERRLRAADVDDDIIALEARLAEARRTADRNWRGSTRFDPIPLVRDIPHRLAVGLAGVGANVPDLPIAATGDYVGTEPELPGLSVVNELGREYPFDSHACHSIGWLGKISSRMDRTVALNMGLDPQGWSGNQGLEAAYDRLLQGVVGRHLRKRTPEGWEVEILQPAQAGPDLQTTLDNELQILGEESLRDWLPLAEAVGSIPASKRNEIYQARTISQGRSGCVLMDCRTGEVLVCASRPGFDLNELRNNYLELLDTEQHPGRPLEDNATWANQAPGSTLKPLVALAGLMEGIIEPDTIIHSRGYMDTWRGRKILPDHPAVPRDWTMRRAIQKSSNVYFATLAGKIGPERLTAWYQRFGLGQSWAVDLDWQRPGLLYTPQSIANDRPHEPVWHKSDTWRLGIGQFLSASPLQLVVVAAAIGNGGTVLHPYIATPAADQAVAEHIDIPSAYLATIRGGMEDVTDIGGTASWLRLGGRASGVKVAAKTGTSEWGSAASRDAGLTPDNAWLIGYAPADNPRVAFAIYIHAAATSGGRACSGVAKQLLERYFERYGVGAR